MNIEKLIEKGLTEEQAKVVMGLLDGNFVTKERFNTLNEENKQLKSNVKERDMAIEGLKKSTGDKDEIKKQLEDLQKAFSEKDEAHAAEMKSQKINNALDVALLSSKTKNGKAVKALLDLENAELLDDGSIKGLSDQIKKLQESDAYLFNLEPPKMKGAKPAQSGNEPQDHAVDISKMGYEEIAALMDDNPGIEI